MVKYKAIISTPVQSKIYVTDVQANSIGDAYNKMVREAEKHEIITILNMRQWKSLNKQVENEV